MVGHSGCKVRSSGHAFAMNDFRIVIKGILAGLIISAPVGPVNVLCISRALGRGRKAGFVSGLGAATADTVYGAIAGFSIQFIIGFLMHDEVWIRLFVTFSAARDR
jgi:threonine/homoserine/homoserine lactone efflux protein